MNTGLLSQAYGIQNARIQTASNIGASVAAEGAGGTRGNAANGLMRAYEQQSLDRNIEVQERENSQALTGMVTQANNAYQDISRERDSWDTGGYRYQMKEAQDAYNKKMAALGRTEFQWQMDNVTGSGAYGWMDYASDIIGGGVSGFNLGNKIDGAVDYMNGRGAPLDITSYLEKTLGPVNSFNGVGGQQLQPWDIQWTPFAKTFESNTTATQTAILGNW
jgi:hypothetical protein